ncbi:MAG: histidine kinase, partial [Ignavibacteria bacterium]|nr:histidine kinase [Ignavibacteria bacterium]
MQTEKLKFQGEGIKRNRKYRIKLFYSTPGAFCNDESHFIFNCLNSVSYLVNSSKHEEANEYIAEMSGLIQDKPGPC